MMQKEMLIISHQTSHFRLLHPRLGSVTRSHVEWSVFPCSVLQCALVSVFPDPARPDSFRDEKRIGKVIPLNKRFLSLLSEDNPPPIHTYNAVQKVPSLIQNSNEDLKNLLQCQAKLFSYLVHFYYVKNYRQKGIVKESIIEGEGYKSRIT